MSRGVESRQIQALSELSRSFCRGHSVFDVSASCSVIYLGVSAIVCICHDAMMKVVD